MHALLPPAGGAQRRGTGMQSGDEKGVKTWIFIRGTRLGL